MKIAFVLKPIFMFWKWLNSKVYKNAKTTITLGKFMAETIKNQVHSMKLDINIIPNWSDPDRIKPISKKSNWFVKKYGLENKFVVLYSGKMGLGHNICTILKAAKELAIEKDIIFLFIGHGPGYKLIEKYIENSNPSNIILLPLQPDEVFPYSIASADVGIVSQEKGMEKLFMPSKIYDMMSAGLAIIGISNGENDLKQLIKENKIGYNINTGNVEDLSQIVENLKNNHKIVELYKKNSRKVVIEKFNIKSIINDYIKIL
jgi:glycosyltransferase involved in cell wall biosynthesis